MDLSLRGKTAVVTGASQGIGRAIAAILAAEGVRVFATARNEELLASLKREVVAAGGDEPAAFAQDFLAGDAAENIARAALGALGHVDILVNNAGASYPIPVDAPEAVWEEAMALNFDRHRQLTQKLLPHFIGRKAGSILNIVANYEPRGVNAAIVAKAGVVAWAKGLSRDLGKFGITVNCLQPGLIDTAQIRRLFPGDKRREFAEREITLGDFGEPEDVANMATFLVSPRARYITGTVAVVDGGMRYHAF